MEYQKINVSRFLIYLYMFFGAISSINIQLYRFYHNYGVLIGILIIISCLLVRLYDRDNGIVILGTLIYFALNVFLVFSNPNAGIGAVINILILIYLHVNMKIKRISNRFINVLTIIYVIECLYCTLLSKSYGSLHYESMINGNASYINPNFLAFIVCIMSFQIWATIKRKFFSNKYTAPILNILLIFLNIGTVSNLDSRSSYLAILVFFCLVYFYPQRFVTKNKILFLYIMVILFSIIIPIIYVYMYKHGISIDSVGSISKRTFTGREIIWMDYINSFSSIKDWLIGLGSQATIHGATDMHNMTLSLIKNGGIISMLLVYGYIGREIKCCFDNNISRNQFAYLAAVLSSLIIGFFESIFLSSQFFIVLVLLLYEARITAEYK